MNRMDLNGNKSVSPSGDVQLRRKLEYIKPADIERRSMEIIEAEMRTVPPVNHAPVIKRVIHATADFDYEENLQFSESAVAAALKALHGGTIVCDTNMVRSGINAAALERHDCKAVCFMADADVAEKAKAGGMTRAIVSMEKAASLDGPLIFAIGNAPTALIKLEELISEKKVSPSLVIGVPVGFVNVIESKELIKKAGVPYIVAAGRKGGSTVAAAICNALLYMLDMI
jgi:precorrin-8X/cobalt-precorrin-8 methylmutase